MTREKVQNSSILLRTNYFLWIFFGLFSYMVPLVFGALQQVFNNLKGFSILILISFFWLL